MKNILPNILESGKDSDTAISIPNKEKISYKKLKILVDELSKKITSFGTQNEKPIIIVLKNNAEFMISFLAVTKTNSIAAPLNPDFTEEEFNFYLDDINPSLIITTDGHPVISQANAKDVPVSTISFENGSIEIDFQSEEYAEKDVSLPNENNSCLFLHTSGTTSRPKGVPLKHKNLIKSLDNIINTYNLSGEDVALVVMPLFHVHGLIGVALSTLASGGQIVIPEKFSASNFW